MGRPTKRTGLALSAVAALAIAVSACTAGTEETVSTDPSASDPRSAAASPPMSSVPPPAQVEPSEPPKLPTEISPPISLTGELVGDGHSLVVAGQVRWILLGDVEGHTVGDRVTVSGQPVLIRGPDPMERDEEPTLKVTSIRPA